MNQSPLSATQQKQARNLTSNDRRDFAKTEIVDGRAVAKPAANRWHNIISTNFVIAVGSRINRNTCELYSGDMPVRIGADSVAFPDAVILNGEPEFIDDGAELLTNPTIVAEIIGAVSKSTDRMQKLEGFLAIPKIKEALLINETEMRVEHYARQNAKQWIYRIYDERDDVISLDAIGIKISLAEVYAQVKLKESHLSSKAVN